MVEPTSTIETLYKEASYLQKKLLTKGYYKPRSFKALVNIVDNYDFLYPSISWTYVSLIVPCSFILNVDYTGSG